jgi:hypothetical protein
METLFPANLYLFNILQVPPAFEMIETPTTYMAYFIQAHNYETVEYCQFTEIGSLRDVGYNPKALKQIIWLENQESGDAKLDLVFSS